MHVQIMSYPIHLANPVLLMQKRRRIVVGVEEEEEETFFLFLKESTQTKLTALWRREQKCGKVLKRIWSSASRPRVVLILGHGGGRQEGGNGRDPSGGGKQIGRA